MSHNFAELLKPWPIQKAPLGAGSAGPTLPVEWRQIPLDESEENLDALFKENSQTVIYSIYDWAKWSTRRNLVAKLMVRWEQHDDYKIPMAGMVLVSQHLGEFLQGQLCAQDLGQYRIGGADLRSFNVYGSEKEYCSLVIEQSRFEAGYNSMAYRNHREFERPYVVRTREKQP